MPFLSIRTNLPLLAEQQTRLLTTASRLVAEALGKPERYVMVSLESGMAMRFAGSDEPLAYLELKSIGLPGDRTASLSQALCSLLQEQLGIEPARVYTEFTDAKGALWGWNGGTF